MVSNEEDLDMKGDGLTRDPRIDPPAVRRLLKSIGGEVVQSIKLVRTPLTRITKFLLNVASVGQLNEKMKEADIDELFHLRMIINDKYSLEKNEVIRLYKSNKIESGAQVLPVNVSGQTTIQEMLDKTKQRMGDSYGSYNAVQNNCGDFLFNVLSANGWITQEATNFTKQRTAELFKKFPSLTEKIVNLGTDVGAVVDKVIQGEGHCGCQCGGQEITEVDTRDPRQVRLDDLVNRIIPSLQEQLQEVLGMMFMDMGNINFINQSQELLTRINEFLRERDNLRNELSIREDTMIGNIEETVDEDITEQQGGMEPEEEPRNPIIDKIYKVYNFQLPECKMKF